MRPIETNMFKYLPGLLTFPNDAVETCLKYAFEAISLQVFDKAISFVKVLNNDPQIGSLLFKHKEPKLFEGFFTSISKYFQSFCECISFGCSIE